MKPHFHKKSVCLSQCIRQTQYYFLKKSKVQHGSVYGQLHNITERLHQGPRLTNFISKIFITVFSPQITPFKAGRLTTFTTILLVNVKLDVYLPKNCIAIQCVNSNLAVYKL